MTDKPFNREGFSGTALEWDITQDERYVDHLTGLFNRRYFDEKLIELKGTEFGLLIIDMDGLKDANDKTGSHQFGNRLLREIADEIRLLIREKGEGEVEEKIAERMENDQRASKKEDLAFRIGGDEFAVTVDGVKDPRELQKIANRLNAKVNSHTYTIPDQKENRASFGLSVSIGGAVSKGDLSAEALERKADRALYEAKTTGRNKAIIAK